MIYKLSITYQKITSALAFQFLNEMSSQFTPPLSTVVNLKGYADKLSKNAEFQLCKYYDTVLGLVAYYPNKSSNILYIPVVWVNRKYQGKGIAKQMLKDIILKGIQEDYASIELEVLKDNIVAYNLYLKLGFRILEDRGMKALMRYGIKS